MVRERFNILTSPDLSDLFVYSLGSNFDQFVMHQLSQTSETARFQLHVQLYNH